MQSLFTKLDVFWYYPYKHSVAKTFPYNICNICAQVIPNRKPLLPLCFVAVSDMEEVFSN